MRKPRYIAALLALALAALGWWLREQTKMSTPLPIITKIPSGTTSPPERPSTRSVRTRELALSPSPAQAGSLENSPRALLNPDVYSPELEERISTFILEKNPTAQSGPLEFWVLAPSPPPSAPHYEIRPDVVEFGLNHPATPAEIPSGADIRTIMTGTVDYLPAENRFYIQWNSMQDKQLYHYGPFEGDPYTQLDIPRPEVEAPAKPNN